MCLAFSQNSQRKAWTFQVHTGGERSWHVDTVLVSIETERKGTGRVPGTVLGGGVILSITANYTG